ncbi:MAG: hypothetical protein IPJ19_12950 [Planctomycetes bacterium]|nr:hypothetical protein [Planctomycetota bacterium]
MLRFCSCFLLTLALGSSANAQFTPSAALPGDLAASVSAGNQLKSDVACGGTHFLAVWQDTRSALGGFVSSPNGFSGNSDVYGVLLDATGAVAQSAPIVINQAPWDQTSPQVAWNGTNYLVVWETTRLTQFWHTQGIYATRVTPAGVVLDDPPIAIDDSDDFDERFPVVSSDGVNWAVAWTDQPNQNAVNLSGALVDPSGLVFLKRVLVPSPSPLPTNYKLEFAQNRYGISFERNYSGGIAARLFDTTLVQVGTEVSLAAGTLPDLGTNGNEFYVSWRAGGVRGTPVSTTGGVAIPGGALLSGTQALGDPHVAVAWDGVGWTVTYSDYTGLWGSQTDAAGNPLASGPFVVTSGVAYVNEPTATAGTGFALSLWTDWRHGGIYSADPFDIYASTQQTGGVTGNAFPITVSPRTQVQPAIAGDAIAGYLIAFQSRDSSGIEVVAQRLDALGTVLDPQPIVLHSGGGSVGRIDVAWDGSEWMVVWHEIIGAPPPQPVRSFFRRVRADGIVLDPQPVDLMNGDNPQVAAVGGTFLVSTHWHFPPVQSNEIYHFKRVDGATGAELDPSEVVISGGSGSSDLVGFDDRWLIVWGGVSGAFVLGNGSVQTPFLAANTGSNGEAQPNLARNGDEALLSFLYNGSSLLTADMRARRIRKDGTLLDSATGSFVSSAPNGQFAPAAVWTGDQYLVTYTDYRDHPLLEPGIGDIYAAHVSASNVVLDVPDLPVQNRWPTAEGRSAVAGGNQRALIASTVAEAGSFGTWRIHLQLDEPQGGTPYCYGDGSAQPCPCNNNGLAGHGCENSAATGGARLGASGTVHPDQVVLDAIGELPHALSIVLQGNQEFAVAVPFGDGLRCVGGILKRLYIRNASGGALSVPAPGDPSITQRSAQLGDTIPTGAIRGYQIYYRDPSESFCASPQGNNWNITNAVRIQW